MEELRKFIWVGRNKKFNEYWVTPPMTTIDLLNGNYQTFFALSNRDEGRNCEFIMEIFEGDNLIYHTKNSMSGMQAVLQDGKFVGVGPFNTHPMEIYFNALDFEGMEFDRQSDHSQENSPSRQ